MIAARKEANLTQSSLAKALCQPQSFVAKYENGERRLDVVEFLNIIQILGLDSCEILKAIEQMVKEDFYQEKI